MKRLKLNGIMEFLSKREFKTAILILLSALLVLTLALLVQLSIKIYTKDEQSFIPEDVRGAVREGIDNIVAKPLADALPSVGDPILESKFVGSNSSDSTTISNDSGTSTEVDDGWKVYKNEELGFEIKIPEEFEVYDENTVVGIKEEEDGNSGIWFYPNDYSGTVESWWDNEKNKYNVNFKTSFVELGSGPVLFAESDEGMLESHYVFKTPRKLIDVLVVGGDMVFVEIIKTVRY